MSNTWNTKRLNRLQDFIDGLEKENKNNPIDVVKGWSTNINDKSEVLKGNITDFMFVCNTENKIMFCDYCAMHDTSIKDVEVYNIMGNVVDSVNSFYAGE